MEGKGHNDETTSLDCTRWLPDEILDMILVGVSISGEPFLDVHWRWAASRVCKRWRAIVVAVPYVPRLQHLLPGQGHRIRRHVQQGRALCLSVYGQFGARARLCDMSRPPPLLMHLMRIAADQLDAVEPALMSMRDMRMSKDDWRMLGPLAHCGPCNRLADANMRHWCVMCRVAARAGATNCFAVLWRRLPNGHTRKMLHEAVIGDRPAIVSHILVCKVPTYGMIYDLWPAIGFHGAVKVAVMLLDMERGRTFEIAMHDGTRAHRSCASARLCSPWLAHAARMNRAGILHIGHNL